MACAGCERRRQIMKAVKEKAMAHAARLLNLRRGGCPDGKTQDAAPAGGEGADAAGKPAGKGSAADAGAEHQQRRVEKAKGAGAGAGRTSMPRVRKTGGRKAGAG